MERLNKRRFMFRMLLRYLLTLLLPTILMGGLFAVFGYYYLKNEYKQTNFTLLEATLNHVELMLNEMDSMILSFDGNADTINKCWHVLNEEKLTYQDHQNLNNIVNVLSAPANARSYLDSVYVYYPNPHGRYILSNQGIVTLQEGEEWYESYLERKGEEQTWSERRRLQDGTEVVSVYQILKHDGVIVLNLHARNVEKLLESSVSFSGQGICVLNDDLSVIFHGGEDYGYTWEEFAGFLKDQDMVSQDREDNVIYMMSSTKYRWHYISVIPRRVFYRLPMLIIGSTSLIVLFLLAVGVMLSYQVTRQNNQVIGDVMGLIEAAKEGRTFEPHSKARRAPWGKRFDYASYIMQELIEKFVQQDFLKVQLSEKKYKLRSMELLAMQSQMNPHFLYNTLEIMNWEIMGLTGGRNKVNEMMESLSEILAYSLDGAREYVPLSEEIYITKCYIGLLIHRFGDSFCVEWYCEKEAERAEVVKFILQPLIENAVTHGTRARERKTAGRIRVRVREREGRLEICVSDNGIGIPPRKLKELREGLKEGKADSGHIGIFNTNKRLQLAYGEDAGIWIGSREGWGTMVKVRLSVVKK